MVIRGCGVLAALHHFDKKLLFAAMRIFVRRLQWIISIWIVGEAPDGTKVVGVSLRWAYPHSVQEYVYQPVAQLLGRAGDSF